MTSGQFASIALAKLWVRRDDRQRKSLVGIDELAQSIQRIGLINPITITRDGGIRAGERRFEAVKSLGWTHISVQYVEEMSEHELQLLELDENLRRVDLPWPDQCDAIRKYHMLREELEPGWTMGNTAEALGFSESKVKEYMAVGAALEAKHPIVLGAKQFSVARNVVYRDNERKRTSELHKIIAPPPVPLLQADFNEWVKSYDGPKFNLLHCDFPYGIGAHDFDQNVSSSMSRGVYDDTDETADKLEETLSQAMNTIVAPSAHMIFWFAMPRYCYLVQLLKTMGWWVQPRPLVWWRSNNAGNMPDPRRRPLNVYETAFLCSRGDRFLVQPKANLFPHTTVMDRVHPHVKPTPMLRHFLSMVVDANTVMLDPTCGSGTAVKAAKQLGAHYVLGLENNQQFYEAACANWNNT